MLNLSQFSLEIREGQFCLRIKQTRLLPLSPARVFVASVSLISAISFGLTGCAEQPIEITPEAVETSEASPKSSADDAISTVMQTLVSLGPRVTGTPTMEAARTYLLEEYRQAGYVTDLQPFTYIKFQDNGSSLTVNDVLIEGRALSGSPAGAISAPLVATPGVGRADDFTAVDVRGAIAIVRRGEITFLEKANNAADAGAVGLVIVNHDPDNFFGSLGELTEIPVLALAGEAGDPLLERLQSTGLDADLAVNIAEYSVAGHNLIAHLEGVTQPRILLGGHYDSVTDSPGANDNASGTAVVLEIARQLANTPLARQTWFVAFDGEEDGLHGSRAFVRQADSHFLSGLSAMLNFDMVGVNDGLKVSGAASLTDIAQEADQTVDHIGSAGGSDHVPFSEAEIPILFFTRGLDSNYHSPNDVQFDSSLLNETVQLGLDVVEQLLTAESGESEWERE